MNFRRSTLDTLLRLREHRRDVARTTLASRFAEIQATELQLSQARSELAALSASAVAKSSAGVLNLSRMQTERHDRDKFIQQIQRLESQRLHAIMAAQQAQADLARKTAEVDALQNVVDRVRQAQVLAIRRSQEHAASEHCVSLCNRQSGC